MDEPKIYKIKDYDIWYKDCRSCGYKTGKSTSTTKAKCWKCGSRIQRDFTERALR